MDWIQYNTIYSKHNTIVSNTKNNETEKKLQGKQQLAGLTASDLSSPANLLIEISKDYIQHACIIKRSRQSTRKST